MSNQQLIHQIHQSLLHNDTETLRLLLLDEDQSFLQSVQSNLPSQLHQKYNKFLQTYLQQRKNTEQHRANNDKIRNINVQAQILKDGDQRDGDGDEENILQREIRRKKVVKLEQVFGYGYFGVVKCLMVAYGDFQPLEESIKMMHSQIQTLFEQFTKFLQETASQKQQKAPSAQKQIQQKISTIFKQQYKSFEQITKQYKKAAKCTETNQNLHQNQNYNQQDNLNANANSDDDSSLQSDDQDKKVDQDQNACGGARHMQANTFQESQYLAKLTKNMNQQEYDRYLGFRQVTFVQVTANKRNHAQFNKFVKYLDPQSKIFKPQGESIHLLSFICCRLVRKIIFLIIRNRNNGNLQLIKTPITYEQVLQCGNQLIEIYQQRFIECRKALETLQSKARRYFIDSFQDTKLRAMFPRKYSEKKADQVWEECPHYRQMWVQRWEGEQEIDGVMREKDWVAEEYSPKTTYGKYVMQNYEYYQKKGKILLWQKYFGQQKITKDQEIETRQMGKTRKRVKLQSLK